MRHWIRDARYNYSGWNSCAWLYLFYHFLRVMGWEWLWECDGEVGPNAQNPNHCPDGNMETAGVGSWTAVGTGVPTKVTTPLNTGTQALRIQSAALNDGVRSAALLTMTGLGRYYIAIWAYNDTGSSWEVEVDNGSGAFVSVGNIPDNGGVWTLYHFTFIKDAAGVAYVRIIDDNATTDSVYVDGILVFTSWFEFNLSQSGTDGVITNPDQFSSGSYSFIAGDIGKFVCVYDPNNLANSGCYEISSVAAGVATLNLRSATAVLTAANGLMWRLVDVAVAPVDTLGTANTFITAGFGLQSPHSSGFRVFFRQNMRAGQTGKWINIWSSPQDQEYNVSTGSFWDTGPSSQNSRSEEFLYDTNTDRHFTISPYRTSGTARLFAMVDGGGDFLLLYVRDDGELSRKNHFFVGYPGADADHPGVEEFILASRFGNASASGFPEASWTGNPYDANFLGSATVIGPDGKAVKACSSVESSNGCPSSSSGMEMTQAGPSPWSGDEWLRRVPIVRDPQGSYGCPSEREFDGIIYQGRANMVEATTFDNDNYFHIEHGTVWEWMGESL